MNKLQEEYLEFLAKLEDQDSTPLFLEGDDEHHKTYKWSFMTMATHLLFDKDGFAEEEWERRFRTWIEDQKN